MNRIQASRARDISTRVLAYRAWYVDPEHGTLPSVDILTDRRLWVREQNRQLRRAQVGLFDTAAMVEPRIASTL